MQTEPSGRRTLAPVARGRWLRPATRPSYTWRELRWCKPRIRPQATEEQGKQKHVENHRSAFEVHTLPAAIVERWMRPAEVITGSEFPRTRQGDRRLTQRNCARTSASHHGTLEQQHRENQETATELCNAHVPPWKTVRRELCPHPRCRSRSDTRGASTFRQRTL